MRFWKKAIVTVAASTALLFGAASSAHASPGPADDRMKSVATTWWTYDDKDSTWINSFLTANNARITDLRITTVSPLRFGFTAIRNSGAYLTASWFYIGKTMAQVKALQEQNNARLITAVKYSPTLYAVVMVPNDTVAGWCDTDFIGISSCLAGKHRLTNIWSYGPNRFIVIFVQNFENYGWCWYAGITRAQIDSLCSTAHTVVDISTNSDGTFNVIKLAYDNDGRVADFGTLTALRNYALTAPEDRPLLAVPYISNNTVRWITSFRHNS